MNAAPAPRRVVVDTDVISFLFKADTRADLYRPHLDGRLVVISFMTLAELDQWALLRNRGEQRKQALEAYIARFTVTPYDRERCRLWAATSVEARRPGRPLQTADAWIAATAMLYGVPLVTHNPGDFGGLPGLLLISEAQP